jgi:hypothetical protein
MLAREPSGPVTIPEHASVAPPCVTGNAAASAAFQSSFDQVPTVRGYHAGPMSRAAVLLSALLVLAPACKDREDPGATGTKVTPDSDYDATEPIEDEAFRFRLVPPGPGWKLLRKHDIRRMLPDAVAGAVGPDGVFGGVIVEKLPGVSLDKAVALVSSVLPQAIVEADEPTTVGGLPARRTRFTAVIEGSNFRYVRVVFLRGDYLYQLMTWGLAANTEPAELEPFVAAFSLTEGEVRGEADDRPPVEHADGVTWHIRDGRFQSVVSGLTLVPTGGWRYLVGQELAQVNAEAELAMADATSSAYFALISERYEGGDPSGLVEIIRSGLARNLGPAEPDATRTVAGQSVPFIRYRTEASLEFLVGVLAADGSVTQVMTWYPQAMREPAVAAFEAVLAGTTKLTPPERDALREQLLARKGVVRKAGPRSAFLGEQFHDFAHLVTWTRPRGLYDVQVGDDARSKSAHAVLMLQAPLEGVHAHVEVIEGEGHRAAEHHETIAGPLDDRRDERSEVDGVPVSRSTGSGRHGEVEFRYGVVSAAHQGNAVVMTAWGPASSPTVPASIDAVLDGLGLPVRLPETTVLGGRFTDHHYGISVEEPAGWARSDATPAALGQGRLTQWTQGRSELGLLTVVSQGFSDDEEWMASFAQQTMRDMVATKTPLGTPESSASTLDGQPSRRLAYPDAQVEIAVHDSTLTMIIMVNVDGDAAERFRRSVRWHRE